MAGLLLSFARGPSALPFLPPACLSMMEQAFTIETLQLLILLATLIDVYRVYNQVSSSPSYNIVDNSSPTFLSVLLAGTVCLFAVDVIDNLVQLQRFTHPVQCQTLILTRSWLAPGSVLVRRRIKRTVRLNKVKRVATPMISMSEVKERSLKRRMSEPTTPTRSTSGAVRMRSIVTTPVVYFGSILDEEVRHRTAQTNATATAIGLRTPPPTGPAKPYPYSSSSQYPPKKFSPPEDVAEDLFLDTAGPDKSNQHAQPEVRTIVEAAQLGYEHYLEHLQLMREKLSRTALPRGI